MTDTDKRVRYDDDGVPADLFSQLVVKYAAKGHDPIPEDPEGAADMWSLIRADRYLLIEKNVRGGYWLTSHRTPEEAAAGHDNQEYVEDWEPELLVDLVTGDRYRGVTTTGWKQTHVAGEAIGH